jgi:hypothetical protein
MIHSHQDDGGMMDDGGTIPSLIAATLYGVGSLLGIANVVTHPQPNEETIMHLIVRLLPQFMFASAALLQAIAVVYSKIRKK